MSYTLDELIDLLNDLKSKHSGDMEVICEIHEEHCRTEVDVDDIILNQYPNGDQKIVIWAVLERS